MNQQDREDIKALAEKIDALADAPSLFSEDELTAIRGLVEVAPALTKLAEGYTGAKWFTGAIKFLGGLAAAVAAIGFAIGLFMGDAK